MSAAYVILKILMWVLIVLFAGDLIMQTISYSFYKGDRNLEQVTFLPEKIQVADDLIGYGYSLEQESNHVILCFGGSMYVAYNTVGMYGGYYDCPFLSVDYYGTQEDRDGTQLRLRNGCLFGQRTRLQPVDSALRVSNERGYI